MPTYIYHCKKCKYDKDVVHKITENPEIVCEDCGDTMPKVIRSSNFHLKGSGWFGKIKSK